MPPFSSLLVFLSNKPYTDQVTGAHFSDLLIPEVLFHLKPAPIQQTNFYDKLISAYDNTKSVLS